MLDQSTIGTDMIAANRKRLRMSRTITSIDIAACPPCPITSSGERIVGAGAPWGRLAEPFGSIVGSQMWSGTDKPSQ